VWKVKECIILMTINISTLRNITYIELTGTDAGNLT
jgi:hypothetical protein